MMWLWFIITGIAYLAFLRRLSRWARTFDPQALRGWAWAGLFFFAMALFGGSLFQELPFLGLVFAAFCWLSILCIAELSRRRREEARNDYLERVQRTLQEKRRTAPAASEQTAPEAQALIDELISVSPPPSPVEPTEPPKPLLEDQPPISAPTLQEPAAIVSRFSAPASRPTVEVLADEEAAPVQSLTRHIPVSADEAAVDSTHQQLLHILQQRSQETPPVEPEAMPVAMPSSAATATEPPPVPEPAAAVQTVFKRTPGPVTLGASTLARAAGPVSLKTGTAYEPGITAGPDHQEPGTASPALDRKLPSAPEPAVKTSSS